MGRLLRVVCIALLLLVTLPAAGSVPILYCSDLYHPPDDPDDHFDLLTLFAMPEFDIRGIVIDTGSRGKGRPAIGALRQAMVLSGKTPPYATGLIANLKAVDDTATDQPQEAQGGVELILQVLRDTDVPVVLFATGSLRDVAAAYNREPELFASKVARLYTNAGNSDGDHEWNVDMDPAAYIRILRSGLPVYWVPCFGERHGSYWKFRHETVLAQQAPPVQNFFLYMLTQSKKDPIAYLLQSPPEDAVQKFWKQDRNMWCTAAFLHAAGRTGKRWGFAGQQVRVEDSGLTHIVESGGIPLQTFEVRDPQGYPLEMEKALTAELQRLPKH